jgi:hypothetical protein
VEIKLPSKVEAWIVSLVLEKFGSQIQFMELSRKILQVNALL